MLDDLKSQKLSNYTVTVKKYNVNHKILSCRHKDECVSNYEAHSIYQQLLTDVQEKEILDYINDLSD